MFSQGTLQGALTLSKYFLLSFLCAQCLHTLITLTICVVAQRPRATSRPVQDARCTPYGPRAWPSNPTWIRWWVGGPFSKRFRCFPWTTWRRFPADGRATRVCDYPLFELGFASKLCQMVHFESSDAFEYSTTSPQAAELWPWSSCFVNTILKTLAVKSSPPPSRRYDARGGGASWSERGGALPFAPASLGSQHSASPPTVGGGGAAPYSAVPRRPGVEGTPPQGSHGSVGSYGSQSHRLRTS